MRRTNKLLIFTLSPLLAAGTFLGAEEPERPDRGALEELIEEFREGQQERVEERRALAHSLRDEEEGVRREAMRALIEEQTAEQRALGQRIRERMKEEAVERREAADNGEDRASPAAARTELAETVRGLNEAFRAERDALLENWRETVEGLRDASREDREAAFQDFRDQLNDLRAERQKVSEAARERANERRNAALR